MRPTELQIARAGFDGGCRRRNDRSVGEPCSLAVFVAAFLISVIGVFAYGTRDAEGQIRVRIRTISGGTPGISDYDYGQSVARLGDLDGNGIDELAAGCPLCRRAVIWFMGPNGSVLREEVIFPQSNGDFEGFGISTAGPGDIDGDGVPDLVIGSERDPLGTSFEIGSIWVYFLNRNGTVRSQTRVGSPSSQRDGSLFGHSVVAIGDRNGDGISELAVGAPGINGGRGGVFILFLDAQGRLSSFEELDASSALFGDRLGSSIADIGDLNGDRISDLAVGSVGRTTGRGRVDIALMKTGGRAWELAAAIDAASMPLDPGDGLGTSVAGIGDIDGDGILDIAIGAAGDDGSDEVDTDRGAAYRVLLRRDGSPKAFQRIANDADGVYEQLSAGLRFGSAILDLGDLDGDGVSELIVGTAPDFVEDPTPNNALWILYSLPHPLESRLNIKFSPTSPIFGQPLRVSGRWGIGLTNATLFFRRTGEAVFLGAPMFEAEPEIYSAEIPAFSIGNAGVEYFVTLESTAGLATRIPPSGFASAPVELPEGVRVSAPHGSASTGYRLISFPLTLIEPDARQVLEDDLGPYDPVDWRMFGLRSATVELGDADFSFSPGQSFWLLSRRPGLLVDSGPGTTVPTDVPFPILVRPGWNLVANPFLIPVPASSMYLASGSSIDAIRYTGDWNDLGETLAPLEGAAVFIQSLDTLFIDPTADRGAAKSLSRAEVLDWTWSITVSASAGEARDMVNIAGVHPEAADGADEFDRPEPPSIGDYVSVYFRPYGDSRLLAHRTDARPQGQSGYVWPMEVLSEVPAPVRLAIRTIDVPRELEIWLVDDDVGTSIRMESGSLATVAPFSPGHGARRLRLVVGDKSFVEDVAGVADIADHFELDQNYPNPFNTATTIRYSVPERSRVVLKVVDLLGREIATLVSREHDAGRYSIVWDGADASGNLVSSGVFVARLEAGAYAESIALTLVK